MPASTPRRVLRTSCGLAILSTLVPLGLSAWSVVAGLPAAVATGLCPPAPPDIPAYPCTVDDYLLRMTVGPWALMGHFAIWGAWIGLILLGGLGAFVFYRARRSGSQAGS